MGKAKRGRTKPKVPNPIAVPPVAQSSRHVEDGSGDHAVVCERETEIQTIIEQLQSSNVEDKIFGLHSLANVFEDPTSVADVMQHKIVRMAGPLLLESSSFVRNAAAGALRNLSACGSEEICELLVEQDIMTPLAALIQKYAAEWTPTPRKQEKEGVVDEQVDTFVQCVHLLWNLCESNSRALKYFNDGHLLPILVKCLDYNVFGLETSVAVARCLTTVSEDNIAISLELKEAETDILKLVSLEGTENVTLLLRTLSCGLLLNISGSQVSGLAPPSIALVMKCLSDVLAVDQRQQLNALTSDLTDDAATIVQQAGHLLDAQQTALEILANLCSDDTEEEMDQDMSDSSGELFNESDIVTDEGERFTPNIATEVHEAVVSYELVRKVWEKTSLPADNVCAILLEHAQAKTLASKLSTLRCRAFLCLNNLLSGLDVADVGGPDNLYKLWLDIGRLVFKQDVDAKLLEAATSAMRAALQRLAEIKASALFGQLSEADIQLMFTGAQQCADPNVRANLIRSVGTLGMIITHSSEANSAMLLKNIGRFLTDVSSKEAELWVVAEALDTIMDVFGEDETDAVAAEISLVERLRALMPTIKAKVRLQRKHLGEHHLIVTTVNANLGRFIKYKSDRLTETTVVSDNGHANGHA